MTLLAFLVVVTIVVFFHELGHWGAARMSKVRVDELSIGFGKELFGFNKFSTRWKVSLVPLGGYVKIHGLEEPSKDKDAISSKSPLTNIWIFFAGPLANFIFAFVVTTCMFLWLGVPKPLVGVVGEVVADSPAQKAGLEMGDRITSINGKPIADFGDIVEAVQTAAASSGATKGVTAGDTSTGNTAGSGNKAGASSGASPEAGSSGSANSNGGSVLASATDPVLFMELERGNKILSLTAILTPDPQGNRFLGIRAAPPEFEDASVLAGLKAGAITTIYQIEEITTAIVHLFVGKNSLNSIGGPVAIARISGDQWERGAISFFSFLALISINLGLINLVPIPPLDGGRILLKGLEPLLAKSQVAMVEKLSVVAGFGFLMVILIYATWNDIQKALQ